MSAMSFGEGRRRNEEGKRSLVKKDVIDLMLAAIGERGVAFLNSIALNGRSGIAVEIWKQLEQQATYRSYEKRLEAFAYETDDNVQRKYVGGGKAILDYSQRKDGWLSVHTAGNVLLHSKLDGHLVFCDAQALLAASIALAPRYRKEWNATSAKIGMPLERISTLHDGEQLLFEEAREDCYKEMVPLHHKTAYKCIPLCELRKIPGVILAELF